MEKSSPLTLLAILFVGLVNQSQVSSGENILSVTFFSSKSHQIIYEPLLTELANRGHSLTIVTPFKGTPHKNIKEIVGLGLEDFTHLLKFDKFQMRIKNEKMNPFSMGHIFDLVCRSYYNMTEVKALAKQKFDLVFVSSFMNECTFGLLAHINAPYIINSPVSPFQWTAAVTGTPSPSSFVPLLFFGYSHRMSFTERVFNMLGQVGMQTYMDYAYIPSMEKVYREFLGQETPSLHEIQKNVSLILANSHMALNHPRPLMPDIVEVGGMHCRPAKPVPKDLDDFLTGSGKDGFIYFSMGSVLKAHEMPETYRKMLISVFSKLKQRVVWKWETEHMDDLPKNVKLSKWLPQQDVLGHPNIKMFITHGGLGSIVESVYHGVPLIGIPMFGDQDCNMQQSESNGFALTLEFRDLTEESVLNAINTMLNNPKYTQRVKELSAIYRDRPQKPLDNAVYWSEYVMRHKGALHLRSPARDLNWAQYHSIDVVAFVTAAIFIALYLVFATLRCICRKLCRCGKTVPSNKKKN